MNTWLFIGIAVAWVILGFIVGRVMEKICCKIYNVEKYRLGNLLWLCILFAPVFAVMPILMFIVKIPVKIFDLIFHHNKK